MSTPNPKPKDDILNRLFEITKMFLFVISQAALEVFYGIKNRSIPYGPLVIWGALFNILIIFKLDQKIFMLLKIGAIYPTRFGFYLTYMLLGTTLGFLVWGIIQSQKKSRMTNELTECFINSGLKSPTGKLPNFISDLPVDEYVRELVVTNAYQPVNKFKEAQNHIATSLKIYIDEIKESRASGTVQILYSHKQIPSMIELNENIIQPMDQFMIGQTRIKGITSNLIQTPHLLVGGQTGGGKSTFLRSLITTLYTQNKNYEFILIDMKGGLEFQLFDSRKRISVISNSKVVKEKLSKIDETLNDRFLLLKDNKCKDLEEFSKLNPDDIKTPESLKGTSIKTMNRLVIVIDEAAELFLSSSRSTISDTQEMIRKVMRLAAQGRAVGIHLIIATQKPDSNAVNTQIKANLTGILSFPMATLGASMSILGNGRAKELPNIPGRAIWRSGLDQFEVQTPFISPEQAKLELDKVSPITAEVMD